MLRKIGYSLLCAGSLFTTSALAMTYNLVSGLNFDYKLLANSPIMLGNPYYKTVTATCTLSSSDKSNTIEVEMLNKSSKVNGEQIRTGEGAKILTVHSESVLTLEADGRAIVKLTNKGPSDINANCTVYN